MTATVIIFDTVTLNVAGSVAKIFQTAIVVLVMSKLSTI
jgi:hypothetical protein